MRGLAWILAAMCMASAAHAEDWLAGEYEVVMPDRPAWKRFVLVVTQVGADLYRDAVFEEVSDATTGRTVLKALPRATDGVRLMPAEELAKQPELVAAKVRCATVDVILLCRIPDGATLRVGDGTLVAGYFASGMHMGVMDVRKRKPGDAWPALPPDRPAP